MSQLSLNPCKYAPKREPVDLIGINPNGRKCIKFQWPAGAARARTFDSRRRAALDAKVDFLSRPERLRSYAGATSLRRETHMSWVFLAGDRVYKLKKPVRFPYLDFSTLERREAACRAELRLNRRLAPDIYLDVVPLTETGGRLSIGGDGTPVDWLVMMKRLDERFMLDLMIEDRRLEYRAT